MTENLMSSLAVVLSPVPWALAFTMAVSYLDISQKLLKVNWEESQKHLRNRQTIIYSGGKPGELERKLQL